MTTAAIIALEEALAVNRALVRQATYGEYLFPFERHADLSQLERERQQLVAGLRVLRTISLVPVKAAKTLNAAVPGSAKREIIGA